jgi:FHA domain
MSKLVLLMPDGTTLDVPLNRERMTIGRRADNDVCLPNLAVSGEHAAVVTILADSFLEDLGSTNGTLVNGKAIAKHFLRDGDEIDIGRHKFVYCADDDAAIEPRRAKGSARTGARDLEQGVALARPFVRGKNDGRPRASGDPAALLNPGLSSPSAAPLGNGSGRGPSDDDRRPRDSGDPEAFMRADPPAALETPSLPVIRVLTGPDTGKTLPLTKAETTIGRPGIQVAAIVKSGDSFFIKRLEGERAPTVNGQAAAHTGTPLAQGDRIEIAGTTLEFVPADRSKPRTVTAAEGAEAEPSG